MTLYFGLKMIKNKIQKPIDIEAHLKYRCPECGYDYWISLAEAQTKNFKIVCDCKTVFRPKRIKKIKILFESKIPKQSNSNKPVDTTQDTSTKNKQEIVKVEQPTRTISNSLRDKCVAVLITYGFTKNEAKELIVKTYSESNIEDPILLVKQALSTIGANNE